MPSVIISRGHIAAVDADVTYATIVEKTTGAITDGKRERDHVLFSNTLSMPESVVSIGGIR